MKFKFIFAVFIFSLCFYISPAYSQRYSISEKTYERVSVKSADYNGFRRNKTFLAGDMVNTYIQKYLGKEYYVNITYFIPAFFNYNEFYGVTYFKDGLGRKQLRIETSVLSVDPEKVLKIVDYFLQNEKPDNQNMIQYQISQFKNSKYIDTAQVNSIIRKPATNKVSSLIKLAYSCDYFLDYLKLPFNCFFKDNKYVITPKSDSSKIFFTTPDIMNFVNNNDNTFFLFDDFTTFNFISFKNDEFKFDKYEIKNKEIDTFNNPVISNLDNKMYFLTYIALQDTIEIAKKPNWWKNDPFFSITSVITFIPDQKLLIDNTWDMIENKIIKSSK